MATSDRTSYRTGAESSRNRASEDSLLRAQIALGSPDQSTRLQGFQVLSGLRHPDALQTALHAFQAHEQGVENIAAQRSIHRLCGYFPQVGGETAIALVALISARVEKGILTLTSLEFSQSCRTMEAVLKDVTLNNEVKSRIDAEIGSWYEKIKGDFHTAPNDMTSVAPRDLVSFQKKSMPEPDRRSMFAVLSMAMLAELLEGIKTPKATEIKKELLAHIDANGFGSHVLKPLSSHNDPELQDAVTQALERWGRSATTPTNRFIAAYTTLMQMVSSFSIR